MVLKARFFATCGGSEGQTGRKAFRAVPKLRNEHKFLSVRAISRFHHFFLPDLINYFKTSIKRLVILSEAKNLVFNELDPSLLSG
jgi:hypothetical protein